MFLKSLQLLLILLWPLGVSAQAEARPGQDFASAGENAAGYQRTLSEAEGLNATLLAAYHQPSAVAVPEPVKFVERHYRSHRLQGSRLQINTSEGIIVIQAYASGITRVSLLGKSQMSDQERYGVVLQPQEYHVIVTDAGKHLLYDTPDTDVFVQKSPIRLKFIQYGDTLLAEEAGFYLEGPDTGVRFALTPQEALYGAGARPLPHNRRGRVLMLNSSAHNEDSLGVGVPSISVPFLVSSKGYGIFFDNPHEGLVDAGAGDAQILDWRFKGGFASYYVIAAKGFGALMKRYALLTGRQPLPPLWAMGFLLSQTSIKDEQEIRAHIKLLQTEQIPLDAVVVSLYGIGEAGERRRLRRHRSKIPNPAAMAADLEKNGLKTILTTDPYFTRKSPLFQELAAKGLLVENEAGEPYLNKEFREGPAALLDITKPEAWDWVWQYYKKQIRNGVAGWKSVLGEPEQHPADTRLRGLKPYASPTVFAHLWAQMLYEGYQQDFPEQRLFHLSRSAFAGTQRYAVFPWSWDSSGSWKGFQAQIPLMLGMSLSGYGYIHSLAGDFASGVKNPELYARWLQLSAFSPLMHANGEGSVFTAAVLQDEKLKRIVRDYTRLRYRLMPYNYTMAWRNAEEGLPLVLPMNFFDPKNPKLQDVNDQYFWGEHLLVAPVLESDMESRQVVLPSGTWIDFWSGQAYAGIQTIRVLTPLERMPLFVKGGSFIPMTNARSSLSQYSTDTLMLQYYAEGAPASSGYTLYLDNGATTDTAAYQLLKLTARRSATGLALMIDQQGEGYAGAPARRLLRWEVVGANAVPANISWKGQSISLVAAKNQLAPNKAYYDHASRRLHVWVMYEKGEGTLQMDDVDIGTPAAGQIQRGNAMPIGPSAATELVLLPAAVDPKSGKLAIGFEVPSLGNYTLELRDAHNQTVFIRTYYGIAPGRYREEIYATETPLPDGRYTLLLSSPKQQIKVPLNLKKPFGLK